MLKKIRIADVRLGMHLHALEGAWLEHPFWKTRFLLDDPADVARLRASPLVNCWIDVAKGLDVATGDAPTHADPQRSTGTRSAAAAAALPHTSSPAPSISVHSAAPGPADPPASRVDETALDDELGQAAEVIRGAAAAVRSLLSEVRLGHAVDAEACAPVVREISGSVARHPAALISLARLRSHDDYSYMHSVAVCALMVALARELGHDEQQVRDAGTAGLLHDMGKALMPLEVLNKPGRLTPSEFDVIRSHPQVGHELLQRGRAVPAMALDVCLHHHERPDGKGYPFALQGEALSLAARMGAVCDVYDAITSNRPYKSGWDPAESIARMAEWTKEGQFDAAVFAAFVKSLGIYPTGSLVRLKSGRLAVVVEQSPAALTRPRVKVFFSTRSQLPLARETVNLADAACSDRIVARESNAAWRSARLDELWAGAGLVPSKG